MFPDASGRPLHATLGEPLYALLGDRPATPERTQPEGNLALVPPYSKVLLLNQDFAEPHPLVPIGTRQRLKGWQGLPVISGSNAGADFGAAIAEVGTGTGTESLGKKHVLLGIGVAGPSSAGTLATGARAILTQELRNPRAGTFTIVLHAGCGGSPADWELLRANFQCRLVLFGYRDLAKNMLNGMREYASMPIELVLPKDPSEATWKITLTRALRSQDAGAAEIEMGVGLAVILEKMTPGDLVLPAGARAHLQISRVDVSFVPRPRNDDVRV
jgi:hypothetical protein